MELSVILVNYNSTEDLKNCLTSLHRHLSNLAFECCVVDNASATGDLDALQRTFPAVKIIRNSQNFGFAKAMNQGLRETHAPFVLWINPDAALQDKGITILVEFLKQNPAVGIVGPKILDPDGGDQLSCRSFPSYETALFSRYSFLTRLFPKNPFSKRYLGTDRDRSQIQTVDWVSGACLLHKRELSEKLGGLDERFFMYCEDTDFCLRARQAGWSTVYHPGATVEHSIGASSQGMPLKMIQAHHQSMWHYYTKHFKRNPLKDFAVCSAIKLRCLWKILLHALIP